MTSELLDMWRKRNPTWVTLLDPKSAAMLSQLLNMDGKWLEAGDIFESCIAGGQVCASLLLCKHCTRLSCAALKVLLVHTQESTQTECCHLCHLTFHNFIHVVHVI